MKGITALMDTYECQGQEYYTENVNSESKNILILRQRTNVLERSVEETRSEITEVRTDLNNSVTTLRSEIKQTSDQIQLTVAKTQKEWNLDGIPYTPNYTGHGTPASAGYAAASYKNKYYMNLDNGVVYLSNGSAWVQQPKATVSYFGYTDNPNSLGDAYLASKNNGKYYLNQANGKLYYSNGTSWVLKKTCSTIQVSMQSQITQNANSISLKVSQGSVISQLNLEIGDGSKPAISMTTGRFEIKSTYFNVRKSDGWLTTTGATIGGFTIDSTSFYSNKSTGVYLAPSTVVNRSISNIGTKACLFAIGSNFGVGSDGTVYANGVNLRGEFYHSGSEDGYTGTCHIHSGIIDMTTSGPHNLIHLKHGNLTVGIGADDVYFERTGSDKVYVNSGWDDIIIVGKNRRNIKATVQQAGYDWD
jgi:hypothetical protein